MALAYALKYHRGCGVLYKTHLVRKCTADCVFVRLCMPRCYVSSSALAREPLDLTGTELRAGPLLGKV